VENDPRGLQVAIGATGATASHWSFGQLCSLASPGNSPASYFRETNMPSPMIADCLNYNLRFTRGVEDIGVLLTEKGLHDNELRSVNGPNYGRIYDADAVDSLVDKFGDGVNGTWRVPGEFGQRVAVTKDNTTLYASDRDMFVFLADEEYRIEIPGRRDGKSGSFARGFFVWNSEVGKTTLGAGFFLFDYVCCNRIVWGASDYTEIRIRHTKGAPEPLCASRRSLQSLSNSRSKIELMKGCGCSQLGWCASGYRRPWGCVRHRLGGGVERRPARV
jgi:hypothetical protein